MMRCCEVSRALRVLRMLRVLLVLAVANGGAAELRAQAAAPAAAPARDVRAESVSVTPSAKYAAGGFHMWFWGDNYRTLWATPLKVEVLDLHSFAGGLTPLKKGGGMQTESLRFEGANGVEYAFRTVDKLPHLPSGLKGAMATRIMADQVSSEHPAAALVAAPLLDAAGVLHATPVMRVMPHDRLLGEFGKEFAGRLGLIEESPGHNKKKGESFAGAHEIIDSDSLRKLLDRDSREHIDTRAMLTARLMDIYLNDIDRHPGQWKWARLQKGVASPWEPIPRDRDQAFVSYHGALIALARMGAPNLVKFDGDISIPGLTYNSLEMDRRLLASLERPVWDSIAGELTRKLTDHVIDGAVHMLPPEYLPTAPAMAATLRLRRDHLHAAATRFYLYLAAVVDVHGTDAADRATVTRLENGIVEVKLESQGDPPYFLRRFDARDTKEVRLYLHGGNDTSVVVGDVFRSIPVKIIGGNGVNWLMDSSHVDGQQQPSTIVDQGATDGVTYGKDTLFLRLPFEEVNGKIEPAGRDRGASVEPMLGVGGDLGMGITPQIGLTRFTYGFRDRPYASALGFDAAYAFGAPGYRVGVMADKRWEGTPFHFAMTASVSTIADLAYHGLGNATSDSASSFFSVRQQQYRVRPALALALSRTTDLSLGPEFQYTRTDNVSGRYLAIARPYGIGNVSAIGLQLALHHEVFDNPENPERHFVVDIDGTYYPAMMDLTSAFERISFRAGQQVTLPILMRPTLVWRGGAEKVFGNFPFFESAFIGGRSTLLREYPDRYAGDAAVYATSELRIPFANFSLMVPLQAGVIGTAEGGKVFVGGSSPGGWHSAAGGGLYLGLLKQSFIVSCTVTNERGSSAAHCQTGLHITP